MIGGESFHGQICNPITEIVVTRRDEAAPLTVEGVVNRKIGVTAVTEIGEVWGF